MKRGCTNCYHYDDHRGYRPNDCCEPNYDPETMLHNNGHDAKKNKRLPLGRLCPAYNNDIRIHTLRESKSILARISGDIGKLTPADIQLLKEMLN